MCGQNLEFLGYSASETAAKDYMDPEVSSSDIAYPSAETLSNSEAFLYLPTETNQLMDSLWLEVKTGNSSNSTVLIISAIIIIVAIVAILVLVSMKKKKKESTAWKIC